MKKSKLEISFPPVLLRFNWHVIVCKVYNVLFDTLIIDIEKLFPW